MVRVRNLSDIAIIENITAPSSVPPNTPFDIIYDLHNLSAESRTFYGVLLDEQDNVVAGTEWNSTIAPDSSVTHTDSFLGITQSTTYTIQISHEMLCPEYATQADCEAAGCYWWSDGTCHSTPEDTQPEICDWIDSKGGPDGLTITDVFELIDSFIFQTPPPGFSFIPTITEVFGVIDYFLGFDGDAATGCDYFGGGTAQSVVILPSQTIYQALLPNGSGDNTEYIDEYPTPDDDVTYVSSENNQGQTGNYMDLYKGDMSPIPDSATITGITIVMRGRRVNGTPAFDFLISDDVNFDYLVGTNTWFQLNYFTWPEDPPEPSWLLNPWTGQPWTKSDLINLQWGYEVRHGWTPDDAARITQLYLLVDYIT